LRKILGAIIIGVLGVTLIAVAFGLEPWHGFVARPPSLAPTFLKMNLAGALNLSLIVIVLTLLLVTILDTAGTLIGVARQAEMLDSEGRLPRLRQALLADSGAAMLGAALGTWTTTAYIESAAGMEEGGRTGLTALVVAAFFLLSLFLAPLAQTVPLYATAPALIFVACLMAANLGAIKWEDATEYIPALITALLMPSPIRLLPAVCGVEGIRRALSRDQCRGCRHRRRLPAQADLRLTGPCKTLSRSL
jgi:AGZA family xanthine/uracil permease-like MFS transporter